MLAAAAHAQQPPVEAFAALPAMESPSLSPDGSRLAFITFTPQGSAIVVANTADMSVTAVIDTSAAKPRGVIWASDDALVTVASVTQSLTGVTGRIEAATPYGIDLSGNLEVRPLLQDRARLSIHGGASNVTTVGGYRFINGAQLIGIRPSDGRVLMPKFDLNANRVLYAVDPKNDRQSEVDTGTRSTYDWIVDEAGEPVFRVDFFDRHDHFRLMKRENHAWATVIAETTAIPDLDVYGLDGNGELIVGSRPGGVGRYGLYALSTETGDLGRPVFTDPDFDVSTVHFDYHRNRVVGAAAPGGGSAWFEPDLAEQQALLNDAFPGESPAIVSWSRDRKRFVVRTETGDHGPRYYLYDAEQLSADQIASAYPYLDGVTLPSRAPYSYAARDGVSVPGYLTRPLGTEGPAPLVVLPHGGPEARDVGGFDWLAHFFASRGYVVLQPNFRGSGGFGAQWRDAGRGEWGTGVMQNDVTDGVTALVDAGIADPDRVCIVGASYGGYAALAGAVFTPELYRCAAAIAPVSDLNAMIGYERDRAGSSSQVLDYWQDVIGGDLGAARDRLAAISPVRHADSVVAPVLLIHGRDDSVVPISQSRDMENALKRAGKQVELIELNGEDHWLSRGDTRLETLQALDRFLAENLSN